MRPMQHLESFTGQLTNHNREDFRRSLLCWVRGKLAGILDARLLLTLAVIVIVATILTVTAHVKTGKEQNAPAASNTESLVTSR